MTYKQEIIKIKGIGDKTAEDIVQAFPTKKDLELAIINNEHLPFDEDVAEKLRENFKPPKDKYDKIAKESVKLVSTQNLRIRRRYNPFIRLDIRAGTPSYVKKDVADFLLKTKPNIFKIEK